MTVLDVQAKWEEERSKRGAWGLNAKPALLKLYNYPGCYSNADSRMGPEILLL